MEGFNADQIVSAANLTASVWLLALAVVAFWYSRKLCFQEKTDTKIMMIGLGFEALGWAIHRGYWGAVRRLRADMGNEIYLALSNSWLLQVTAFTMVMVGLILILTPVWKTVVGSGWRVIPAALILSTFWFFLVSETYIHFDDVPIPSAHQ